MSRGAPQPSRELDWPNVLNEALTLPGNLGNTYCRFYNYSFLNQLLLLQQGIREPVATYKRWADIGRQVVKGSVAKEIIRPITVTKKDDDGEVEDTYTRFKMVRCIFGVSDTTGEELPPVELPTWNVDTALTTLDIRRVPFTMLDANVQGFATGRELAINPVAVHPAKTTMHELGHIVLGHTTPDQLQEYRAHRGLREFQAEATAYLTMNELEQLPAQMASESRAYISHWLQGDTPPDAAIRQVFSATDVILKAGRVAA